MQFRWLGQLGLGPMLGRHVNECATYYIRMCTLIFGVSPLGLIQSQEKYITSNLAFHRLVCVTNYTNYTTELLFHLGGMGVDRFP